jgi:hypothetical protein
MAISFSLVEAAAGAAIVPAGTVYASTQSVVAAGAAYIASFVTSVFGVGAYHLIRSALPQIVSGVAAASPPAN